MFSRAAPLVTAMLLVGCARPQVQLAQPVCQPVGDAQGVESIVFRTDIATRNMAQQQLLYEIGLLDTRSRPVPARTYRYKNAAGQLAAGRTLMVLQSPWVFENVAVSIPGSELKAVEEDRPAWAEFRVLNTERVVLARQRVRLPPAYAAAAAPGEPVDAPRFAAARRDAEQPPPPPSDAATDAAPLPTAWDEPPAEPPRAAPTAPSRGAAPRRTSPSARAERAAAVRRLAEASRRPPAPAADAAATPAPAGRAPQDDAPPPLEPPPAPPDEPSAPARGTAPVPAPPAPPAAEREYTVLAGDTLIGIAKRELRDPTRWYDIFERNRDVLNSPDELRAGMLLRLPPPAEPPPSRSRSRRP